MFKTWFLICLCSNFILMSGCKKNLEQKPSGNPNQEDLAKKTPEFADLCREAQEKLALVLVPSTAEPQLKDLVVKNIFLTSEVYPLSGVTGGMQITRSRFEASEQASFVRWRACEEVGSSCYPSNDPDRWFNVATFQKFAGNLPSAPLKVMAQACADSQSTDTGMLCGGTTTISYTPANKVPDDILALLEELYRSEDGLLQEAHALQKTARQFVSENEDYYESLVKGKINDQKFQMLYVSALNLVRLGAINTWKYFLIEGFSIKESLLSLGEEKKTLGLASESQDVCSVLPKVEEPQIKLALTGGNPEEYTISALDTPSKNVVNPTEEDVKAQGDAEKKEKKDQEKGRTSQLVGGVIMLSIGLAAVAGSLAYYRAYNKDYWDAQVILREVKNSALEGKPLPPDLQTKLKKLNEAGKFVIENKGYASTLEKVSKDPETKGPLKDPKTGKFQTEAATRYKKVKTTFLLIGSTVLTAVGIIMLNGDKNPKLDLVASSAFDKAKGYLQNLAHIEEAVDSLIERRTQAVSALNELKGPKFE